jgi:hypothetical protein
MGPRLSRREFLDRRREICRARYDQLHAHTYDQVWGRVDPTHAACVAALQDLDRLTALHGQFDGLLCVDAMENVGPEDWPVVLAGFHLVLREHPPAYLTVELPDEPLPEPDGGLVTDEHTGDGYLHLHCRAVTHR